MKALLEKEGMKGYGAYWIIIEKLALLPEPCAPLEYMKPFWQSFKISFAYIKKIIRPKPRSSTSPMTQLVSRHLCGLGR